jgi:hypothetical protein
MKKEAKEIPFARGKEAVQGVGVLSNHEMGKEADFFPNFWEVIERGDGDEEFISDSLAIDHRTGGPSFRKSAFEKRNHVRRLQESSGRKRLHDGGG